jgi:anti-sigma factor RsiW
MSCSPIHLKDYVLKELAEPERRKLETHLRSCLACREELDRLRLTEAALFNLREEEIPQRIAFVSDPVFEPSPWRRWWSGFWGSPARLAFGSAAMLSAAILFSAVTRPGAPSGPAKLQPAPLAVQTIASTPAPPAMSDADIQQRIQAAVEKAVSASQEKQTAQVRQLVDELRQTRTDLKMAGMELDLAQRHADNQRYMAYYEPTVRTAGGGQK